MIEPTSGELLIDDHPLHFGDYSFRSQRIRMIPSAVSVFA